MSRLTPTPRRSRRLIAALAAVSLGLLGAVIPATAASAVGSASGRVVDQVGDPVVGLPLQISCVTAGSGLSFPVGGVVTNGLGFFDTSTIPDASCQIFIPEGTADGSGQFVTAALADFEIDGDTVTVPDIQVSRYVPVTGTIENWTAAMGTVTVSLYHEPVPGHWQIVNNAPRPLYYDSVGDTFTILSPLDAESYTIRFQFNDEAAYLDAFLGGELDDPAHADHFAGVPNVGVSGLTMTMPDAARISGRVTSSGAPLAGIDVEAENDVHYSYSTTDASGNYTIYVRPGSDYLVYAYGDADHAPMTYDGWDGCACEYDPVTTSLVDPAEGIDFDLLPYATAPEIVGFAADEDSNILDDLEVRLYRAVGGVWVLEDVTETSNGVPNFEFLLDPLGAHRLQFLDDDGDILRVVDGATSRPPGAPVPLAPLPACYADLGDLTGSIAAMAILDPATAPSACATIAGTSAASAPGTGGTTTPGVVAKPRTIRGAVAPTPAVTATPTPSATPVPTATPRPTAAPAPTGTGTEEPAPASSTDLWWLLWVGLAVVVVAVIGGVVFFLRRP